MADAPHLPPAQYAALLRDLLAQGLTCSVALKGESMSPTIEAGATLRLGAVEPADLRLGDILYARYPGDVLACRRVLWIFRRENQRWVRTGGDALRVPDPPIPADQVIGRVEAVTQGGRTVTREQLDRGKWRWLGRARLRLWVTGPIWDPPVQVQARPKVFPGGGEGEANGTDPGEGRPPDAPHLNENQLLYEERSRVEGYARWSSLFDSEAAVLRMLEPRLAQARMLDVGVGGGRTTVHFAPRVKQYLGVDSAPLMIEACEARFRDHPPHWAFRVGDARALHFLPAGSFDLVLFSCQGLDTLPHEDRLLALREMRRVCAPGGFFVFTSNNLQAVRSWSRFQWSRYPPRLADEVRRQVALRRLNPSLKQLDRQEYAELYDGTFSFQLRSYHIRPRRQVTQLVAAGFDVLHVLDTRGAEVPEKAWDTSTERIICYVARAGAEPGGGGEH